MKIMSIAALLFSLVVALPVHSDDHQAPTVAVGGVVCKSIDAFTQVISSNTPAGSALAQKQVALGDCVFFDGHNMELQIEPQHVGTMSLPPDYRKQGEPAVIFYFWKLKMQPGYAHEDWYMFTVQILGDAV